MAELSLRCIYKSLFQAAAEALDPVFVTTQLLQYQFGAIDESLLLWLSIIRKFFVPESKELGLDSKSQLEHEKRKEKQTRHLILDGLLQAPSFIPFLVCCLRHKEQLVSYLASEVLSQTMCEPSLAGHTLHEECLSGLYSVISLPNHEPVYALQILKKCLKLSRKAQQTSKLSMILYSSVLWHWDKCFLELSSKLQGGASSKWPELNYIAFLKMSGEIFHPRSYTSCTQENIHLIRDCRCLVWKRLKDLTSRVVTHCTSVISLKEMIKMYRRVVDDFKNTSECAIDVWAMLNNALFVFMESSGVQGILTGMVMQMSGCSDARSERCDDNLKRSVLRGMVVLLMKYGSILKENAHILVFEKRLTTLFHCCGLDVPSDVSGVQCTRCIVFQLLNEQDDSLLDALLFSLDLWKKRSLWLECPTLKFCCFCTHPHSMMLEFLRSVSYDHSILLDFLISAETTEFVEYLRDYLRMCVLDWSDLCRVCMEADNYQVKTNDATATVKTDTTLGDCGAATTMSPVVVEEEIYQETVLDKFMSCFTSFHFSLGRLSVRQLLPVSVDALISDLDLMEDLYEE